MKTKYAVGDTVKVGAKIVKIEIDKNGVKYILSSKFFGRGLQTAREGDLSPGSSKSTPKTSAKTEKTSAKTEKASKSRAKVAIKEAPEKSQKSDSKQQKAAERQQERKRPGRPSKKAVGESEGTTTAAGLKELAKELAWAAE